MKGHFYSHIIEIETVYDSIGELQLEKEESDELVTLMESSIHHAIVDAVLSELSEEDKKIFLKHMVSEKHDELWLHLNEKIEDVEAKIKDVVDEIKEQLHEDIEEVKKS